MTLFSRKIVSGAGTSRIAALISRLTAPFQWPPPTSQSIGRISAENASRR